jgi:hypothetical protein
VSGKAKVKKLTPKQEAFARKVAEGSTASAAYRHAYNAENYKPESVWTNAAKLMGDAKVLRRVEELQAKAAERSLVTVETLAAEYEEARSLAKETQQPAAMSTATTGKARLYGLDKGVTETSHSGSVEIKTTVTIVNPDADNE